MAIIGIDLGTSNSAAAVLLGGRPVIIPSSEGVTLGAKRLGARRPKRWPNGTPRSPKSVQPGWRLR